MIVSLVQLYKRLTSIIKWGIGTDSGHGSLGLLFIVTPEELSSEFVGAVYFSHDTSIQYADEYVRNQLHEQNFAPKNVVSGKIGIFPQFGFPVRGLGKISSRERKRLKFQKLKSEKVSQQ